MVQAGPCFTGWRSESQDNVRCSTRQGYGVRTRPPSFCSDCLGLGLDRMGGEPRTQSLRETEGRIVHLLNSWDTIVGIQQSNPFLAPVRQKFLEIATRLEQTKLKHARGVRRRLASNVQKWSRKL